MKAIILNNLIINHRCFLFWKELVMIAIILVVTIFQTQTQKAQAVDDPSFYNPKMVIVVYSILAMLLIAR
jgi:conjugal transfer/entry exclusion protein